jgi:hypothetical protein
VEPLLASNERPCSTMLRSDGNAHLQKTEECDKYAKLIHKHCIALRNNSANICNISKD